MAEVLLEKLSNFKRLDEESRQKLDRLFSSGEELPKRRHFVRDGDSPERVFVLLSGWAARYKLTEDGKHQTLAFLLPGDVFPIHASTFGTMDHSIVALTDCRTACAPAEHFNKTVLNNAQLAQAFWWATLADKGILRAWILNLGTRSAYCRIAHLICELHFRLRMVGLAEDGSFDFPLTQQDIADAKGLTTVHVNRMVQQLRADGLIDDHNNRMRILDREALCAKAGFDPAYLNPS